MSPPGTLCFSVWLQATSSRQTSRIRALVATETPDGPAAVAFGNRGTTRSATTGSKTTGVIVRSQSKIRSMRVQIYSHLHTTARCSAWGNLPQ